MQSRFSSKFISKFYWNIWLEYFKNFFFCSVVLTLVSVNWFIMVFWLQVHKYNLSKNYGAMIKKNYSDFHHLDNYIYEITKYNQWYFAIKEKYEM